MTEHAPSTQVDDLRLRPLEEADFDRLIALFDAVAAARRWIGTEPGFDRTTSTATCSACSSTSDTAGDV